MAGGKAKGRDLFDALGHPVRRRVLREMLGSGGEISPRELAVVLGEQLSGLSYHVRVLAECKAIELVRTEQIRGSTQHFYRAMVRSEWALSALASEEKAPRPKGRSQGEERA